VSSIWPYIGPYLDPGGRAENPETVRPGENQPGPEGAPPLPPPPQPPSGPLGATAAAAGGRVPTPYNLPPEVALPVTGFNPDMPIVVRAPKPRYVGSTFMDTEALTPGDSRYTQTLNYPSIAFGTPQYDRLVDSLRGAGLLGGGAVSMGSVQNAWEALLGASQAQNEPWQDVLTAGILSNGARETAAGGGQYLGGTSTTRTETVTVYDEESVKDVADTAWGNLLGRAATRKERRALAEALNSRPPQVQVVSGSTAQGRSAAEGGYMTSSYTSQRQTLTPQVGASTVAEEQALQARDMPARLAESVFLDRLLGAMRSPI